MAGELAFGHNMPFDLMRFTDTTDRLKQHRATGLLGPLNRVERAVAQTARNTTYSVPADAHTPDAVCSNSKHVILS